MFRGQKDFELEIILFWLFRFLIALKNTLNHKKKNVVYVTMSLRKKRINQPDVAFEFCTIQCHFKGK